MVREVMRVNGQTVSGIAKKMGAKRYTNVCSLLNGKHMRVENLLRLLDALDCDLIVRSRNETSTGSYQGMSYKYRPEWTITLEEASEFSKQAHRAHMEVSRE